MNVFEAQGWVMFVLFLVVTAIKGFAFVNALLWSAQAYEAAGKLTKPTWCTITGLGFVTALIPIGLLGGLLGIVFLIAALVYLADVRPALREVTSHRR